MKTELAVIDNADNTDAREDGFVTEEGQQLRNKLTKLPIRKRMGANAQEHLTEHNYIDGDWVKYNFTKAISNLNPATGKPICKFPQTEMGEVDRAVASARLAFKSWKKLSRVKRAEYFNRVASLIEAGREDLARVISLETGKNYNESIAEVNEALHMAQYAFGSGRAPYGEMVASEIDGKDSYMLRKPKGVIAVVSPFNFPVAIGAFWCAAPALVEGNTVVLKPSEDAPLSTQMCAEIYHLAGFPPGVFNVIHGDGAVGEDLVRADVDHICFTGSAEVGQSIRKVAAQSWSKTTSCEMGSKSACIIFDDVDMKLALEAAIASAFKLSGQRCVSSGRMIVQRTIYDAFAKRFAIKASKLLTGDPLKNKDIYYGPLINRQAFEKVDRYNKLVMAGAQPDDGSENSSEALMTQKIVERGYLPASQGSGDVEVLLEGKRLESPPNSYFMSPMVYKTEWMNVPYLKNEVFGPHVAIIPFDTIEDAIRIYNDTDYGLAVGVLTDDFRKARIMRDECDAGMIYWNGGSIAAESHLSFGGVKKSGNGFPSAARTFRAVTHEISWTVNHDEQLEFPQGMK